jgi:hypothetical protein
LYEFVVAILQLHANFVALLKFVCLYWVITNDVSTCLPSSIAREIDTYWVKRCESQGNFRQNGEGKVSSAAQV